MTYIQLELTGRSNATKRQKTIVAIRSGIMNEAELSVAQQHEAQSSKINSSKFSFTKSLKSRCQRLLRSRHSV